MEEFLSNRIEKRYRCANKAELLNFLNKNFKEIFYEEKKKTKIMTVYFNTKDRLDSEKTVRCKMYINEKFDNSVEMMRNFNCDLQVKVGNSKNGIFVKKEKNIPYGEVLEQLRSVEESDDSSKSDIMEYIKSMTKNQRLIPFMKIYYSRNYYVGMIEHNRVRITLDDNIIFENCFTNKIMPFEECVMEIKGERTKNFNEEAIATIIETMFEGMCIQSSISKKMIGYELIMH